jgi:signal transduction histidine kinase
MGYVEDARAFAAATEANGGRSRASASTRAILWLTLIYWGTNVAIFSLADVLHSEPTPLLATFLMRIALALLGIGLCFLLQLALRRLERRALWKRVLLLIVLVPLCAESYAWASYFGLSWVAGETVVFPVQWSTTLIVMTRWSWFFIGWAGLAMAVEYAFDAREEEVRASRFQALAQSAKLQALHNQLNPHFLFNSLNSISALIVDRRVEDADRMVDLLASYLRKTLAADPASDVRLIDEIRLQLEYLAIERARYPDLAVTVDVPAELEGAAVPALLLQPLVENAVKHGAARSTPPATIAIRARRDGGEIVVSVENSGGGEGEPAQGAGIGLRNVRERLRHRFGDRQQLTVGPLSPGGYAAVIRAPLENVG